MPTRTIVCCFVHLISVLSVDGVTLSLNPSAMVIGSSTVNPTTGLNMQCSSNGTIDVNLFFLLRLSRRKFTESTFSGIAAMTLVGGPELDPTVPSDIQNRSPSITGSVDTAKRSGTMTLSINAQGLACTDQAEFQCFLSYLDTDTNIQTVTDSNNFTVITVPSEVIIDSPEYYDVNGNTLHLSNNSVLNTGTRIKYRCTANVGSVPEGEIIWERSSEMGSMNSFIPYTPAEFTDIVQETSRPNGCFYRRTSTMYYNLTQLDEDGISFRCRARSYLSGQRYEALTNQQYRAVAASSGGTAGHNTQTDIGSKCDTTNGCSSPYADCTNATCQCRSGYIQNGNFCTADIGLKCDTTNGYSNPYADCTNGTYQCRSEYIQNGTLCTTGALLKPSHGIFCNGTDGFLTCTCVGKGLEWYYAKNNVDSIIATTSNSRIQRQDQAINSATTSNLTFKPVIESDIGWYECRCTIDISNVKVVRIWMAVHVRAQVNVFPFTQTVKNGSNANISCTLINNAELVSLQWFKDGILLQNQSANLGIVVAADIQIGTTIGETIVTEESIIPAPVITPDTEHTVTSTATANYSCRGNNYLGSGNNATATIYVLNGENQYCETETDTNGNITWEYTISGSVNRKPCQSGFKGEVTRNCRSNGSWENPIYSQCVNEKLLNLKTQIDQIKDGVQVTNISTVLADLKNATNPTAVVLRQAELNVVVSMLDKLVNIKGSTGANVSEFMDFLHIASNIIDAGTANAWKGLITKEKQGAETVMKTVEEFVFSDLNESRISNSPRTIHTVNIDVEIGFNSSIEFQPKRKGPSLNNKTITTSLSLYTGTGCELLFVNVYGNTSAYAAVIFQNVSNILQKRTILDRNNFITTGRLDIGPDVMSLQLNPRPAKLIHPLQLIFEAFDTQYHTPLCSYWELNATGTGEGAWSSNNCYLMTQNSSGFVCECNHLTNFAIIMITQEFPETGHNVQLSIISAVGCAVSITCLLLTIFGHLHVWRYVKSRRTCIIMNICVALIFSYGIFLAGVNRTENKAVCTSIAALLHYFYLTVFFLMLVEGIEIAVSVLFVFFNKSRLKFFLPLAWLIPAGIVGASLGISRLNGYGNEQNCWLAVRHGLIWAFVGPAALIILCNAVIIFVVIKKMFNTSTFMSKTQKDKAKTSLRSLGVLLPITGVTWILGIFSVNEDLYVFQYLFTIFNSLQGLFIFIFHCLLNNRLRAAMKEKRRRKQSLEESTTNKRTASNDESRRRETSNPTPGNSMCQASALKLQDVVSSSMRRTIHISQPRDIETDCGNETQNEYYN